MPAGQPAPGFAGRTEVRRRSGCSFSFHGRFHVQNKVHGRPQKVRAVGFGHDCIHKVPSAIGQFDVVGEHDDRNFWPDLLDRTRDSRTIEKAKVVLQQNSIHRPRHKKPQTFSPVGRGQQVVSLVL